MKSHNHNSAQKGNLPTKMRNAIESISGEDLSDVQVHYSSFRPITIQAHAYAQGVHIYLAPGQEKHLAHEAWHVVQQKQGRVQANHSISGMPLNDDQELEQEAEVMGAKVVQMMQGMERGGISERSYMQRLSTYRR